MKTHGSLFCRQTYLHICYRRKISYSGTLFKLWGFLVYGLSFSLETSPITDSDTAKRTVFQRSYSVVASEYDKQHSPSPARVKAVPRRRVHSGDAGKHMCSSLEKCFVILQAKWCIICNTNLLCPSYRGGVFPATTPISRALQADLSPRLSQ